MAARTKAKLQRRATNAEGEDLAEPLPADLDLKAAKVVLFGFDASPPTIKVKALLHYYGIPYKYVVTMPGQKQEGLDGGYTKVPKLVIDNRQINDSAVIFRTLAPLLAGAALTPAQVALESDNNVRGLPLRTRGQVQGRVGLARASQRSDCVGSRVSSCGRHTRCSGAVN